MSFPSTVIFGLAKSSCQELDCYSFSAKKEEKKLPG
jgi:hypothetical protein